MDFLCMSNVLSLFPELLNDASNELPLMLDYLLPVNVLLLLLSLLLLFMMTIFCWLFNILSLLLSTGLLPAIILLSLLFTSSTTLF